MSRPRRHRAPPGSLTLRLAGASKDGWCMGLIKAIYTRQGSPLRWVALGRMCVACHAFWPGWVERRATPSGVKHGEPAQPGTTGG